MVDAMEIFTAMVDGNTLKNMTAYVKGLSVQEHTRLLEQCKVEETKVRHTRPTRPNTNNLTNGVTNCVVWG